MEDDRAGGLIRKEEGARGTRVAAAASGGGEGGGGGGGGGGHLFLCLSLGFDEVTGGPNY